MSGPIEGVRVLDLSQVIAGPYGTALLAHYGAEVVKVEPLVGETGHGLTGTYFALNRGKRDLPIDLQSEVGREVVRKLAAQSDVLVENFRPGVMERLGLGYERLRALNPRLIFVSVSAFGATGPYSHRPGFDPLLQAMTGTERAQGGRHNPPVFMRIAITDYTTAMLHAGAITLALYDRGRSGEGQRLQLSLLRTGIFINAEAFTRYEGRESRQLPDAGQNGFSPLDRMYRCSDDAYIFLLIDTADRWRLLASVPEFAGVALEERFANAEQREANTDALAASLETVFAIQTVEYWNEALDAAGIPCAPVIYNHGIRLFEDVQPIINHYVVSGEHPQYGYLEHAGNFIDFSATPTGQVGRVAPVLGQHTDEVLSALGYDKQAIDSLRQAGVILPAPDS